MTGNVQLYLPERTWGPVRMGGPLVGFGGRVKGRPTCQGGHLVPSLWILLAAHVEAPQSPFQ